MSIINKMHQDFQQVQQENPILAKMPEKKNRKKMLILALIILLIGSSLGFSYLIFQQNDVISAVSPIAEKSIEPVVAIAEKEQAPQSKQVTKSVLAAAPVMVAQENMATQAPVKVTKKKPVKRQQYTASQASAAKIKARKIIAPPVIKESASLAKEKTGGVSLQKADLKNIEGKKESTLKIKTVSLSNAQLAQIHLNQAIVAEKKGDLELAANERKQALTLIPTLNDERKSLALYYYSQGETSKAKGLLQSGALVSPEYSDFNLMLSRMALKKDNYQMAYYYLEQHPPGVAGHLDYYVSHAILARKFHKNKQVEYLYQQLLSQQPNNGRWRMSLAIAQDKQSKVEMAINNYKQALVQADLSLKAKDYINQRLIYLEKSL